VQIESVLRLIMQKQNASIDNAFQSGVFDRTQHRVAIDQDENRRPGAEKNLRRIIPNFVGSPGGLLIESHIRKKTIERDHFALLGCPGLQCTLVSGSS